MRTKLFFIALVAFLLIPTLDSNAQRPLNEKEVIQKTHIDWSKECIQFVISGLVEVDGHTFLNDTCKSPIVYRATLSEIFLMDTVSGQRYENRACEKPGCKVIHMVKKQNKITFGGFSGSILYDNLTITH